MPMISTEGDRIKSLLEGQNTGILWLDEHLYIHYANPAAKFLLDLGSRVGSASLKALLPGNDEFLAALERTAATHETVTLRELGLMVGQAENRRAITVDCTVSAMSEQTPALELLIEFAALDRHMRISRETSLGARHELNRSFARQLAHEIKNPLGSIRGAAQLLERRLPEPALSEYTRLIVSETDRLAALADALLGPCQPADRHPVNLHEIVEHIVHLTRVAGTGLRIVRDYDPSLPELCLNSDQMIQAVLNIAKNAREAVGAGGCIVFRTRVLRQFTLHGRRYRLAACIEIEDDGPGIPAQIQPYLFSPLVSRKPQGSGLGLSIAQELVSRNGGLIEYQTAPGRTVFSVILPMETEHEFAHP